MIPIPITAMDLRRARVYICILANSVDDQAALMSYLAGSSYGLGSNRSWESLKQKAMIFKASVWRNPVL